MRTRQHGRSRSKRKLVAEMNVVPYIDVMLVLLIIFMITTPLLQTGVEVALPQAEATSVDTKDEAPLVVNVDREGRYFLSYGEYQKEPVDAERLLVLVKAIITQKPAVSVLVGGDRDVSYGRVVEAMAQLQSAGVPKVGLLTESEPEV